MDSTAITRLPETLGMASIKNHTITANTKKQYFLTILFSVTSILFLGAFGTLSIFQNNHILGATCLTGSALNIINLIYLHISGKYRVACLIIVILMIGLTVYLVCSGGSNNTGPLWVYVMPILIFYVLELRNGLITLIFLESVIAVILLLPDNPLLSTTYSSDFTIRFLASLFAVSILSFAFEFTRQDWQKEIINLNRLLEEASRTDELTGVTNRRDMNEKLVEEIARFKQNNRPFSLIMGDIDHFKRINDTYGHDCGDTVLKEITNLMVTMTKEQDKVSRWGGEEFLFMLPETPLEKGRFVAERLRKEIENLTIEYDNKSVQVTMSFGIVEYNGSQNLPECLKEADTKLYISKQRGRNCIS